MSKFPTVRKVSSFSWDKNVNVGVQQVTKPKQVEWEEI